MFFVHLPLFSLFLINAIVVLFLLIYGCTLVMEKWYCLSLLFLLFVLFLLESSVCVVGEGGFLFGVGWVVVIL